ncbi:MAG: hypothetical protein LUD47_06015 [Clostridia bacterium]|nr:hypothetical protein [Clostridia bacterium]
MTYLEGYSIVDGSVVDADGHIQDAMIIRVTPCKTADGKTFQAYKLAQKNGKLIDARFRKDCENVPTFPDAKGDYILVLGDVKPSVDKNNLYPKAYIKFVVGVIPMTQGFRTDITLI